MLAHVGIHEISGLFEPNVVLLATMSSDVHLTTMTANEARLVADALPKRRREFATARALARMALARLGRPPAEILCGADRCPIWPAGICGSLSHSDTFAAAAIGATDTARAIGVDVEHRRRLPRRLWPRILLEDEVVELERRFSPAEHERKALIVFSAKEALYKALYPWARAPLSFHGARVAFDATGAASTGSFVCVLRAAVGAVPSGYRALGRYRSDLFPTGELLTGVWFEAP